MTANPLWDYALKLYSAPGVADLCVALQNGQAANVNLLLLCCWAGQAGVSLDISALRSAEDAILDWERAVVVPLRLQRQHLDLSRPDGLEEWQRLLTKELQAERREHDLLFAWFSSYAQHGQNEPCPPQQATTANLANYAHLLSVPAANFVVLRDAALVGR